MDRRISEYWEETPTFMFTSTRWGVRLNGHREKTFITEIRPDQLTEQQVNDMIALAGVVK